MHFWSDFFRLILSTLLIVSLLDRLLDEGIFRIRAYLLHIDILLGHCWRENLVMRTLILTRTFEVEFGELLDGHRHIFGLCVVHDSVFAILRQDVVVVLTFPLLIHVLVVL